MYIDLMFFTVQGTMLVMMLDPHEAHMKYKCTVSWKNQMKTQVEKLNNSMFARLYVCMYVHTYICMYCYSTCICNMRACCISIHGIHNYTYVQYSSKVTLHSCTTHTPGSRTQYSSDSRNASASRVVNHPRKSSLVRIKYYPQVARVLVAVCMTTWL